MDLNTAHGGTNGFGQISVPNRTSSVDGDVFKKGLIVTRGRSVAAGSAWSLGRPFSKKAPNGHYFNTATVEILPI